jgi:hypothetical protein
MGGEVETRDYSEAAILDAAFILVHKKERMYAPASAGVSADFEHHVIAKTDW